MRRGVKFSKKAYIVLGIAAFFNLMSIVFDQLVVQHEDKIRIFDAEINSHKQEINSLLYAHKVFDELDFKIFSSSEKMIGDINYLVKSINYFNSDLPKKINSKEIDKIREVYINKSKHLAKSFLTNLNETNQIFYKIIGDPNLNNYIKENVSIFSDFKPLDNINTLKKYFERNDFHKKNIGNFLENYDFSAKSKKSQLDNYPIYEKLYDELYTFNGKGNYFEYLSEEFKYEFNKSVSFLTVVLENYNNLLNFKNYLILTSILFQIIGLVFLIILFRVLINENR
tara:strand:- start:2496 stop:3344 length:849 start_codon:yes stop_codon:yes gene_type:complete